VLCEQELEPIADLQPINSVDHIKDLEGDSGLVPLQGSDEVPSGRANSGFLGLRFLDAVLPKIMGAGDHGLIHNLSRVSFRNRNQRNLARIATSGLRGRDDPSTHHRQSSRDCCSQFSAQTLLAATLTSLIISST
jgi:hypothetical protein